MHLVRYKLDRVERGNRVSYVLQHNGQTIELPAAAWKQIALSVKDDVERLESGALILPAAGSDPSPTTGRVQ